MRRFALLLMVLALLCLGVFLYGYAGTHLDLRVSQVRVLSTADYPEEFGRLQRLHSLGAVRGTVYDQAPLGQAGEYVILQYSLVASNKGLIKAEMLEAQIMPLPGDVLSYSQKEAQGQDVNLSIEVLPGQQTQMMVYLLCKKDANPARGIQVSYYIWGKPYLLNLKYG